MVVDEDAETRTNLLDYITQIGHPVFGAATGQESLAAYLEKDPALVLLDAHLPEGDCLQTLKKMKKAKPTCRVVVMSAHSRPENIVEAMKLGAENYLTKPIPLPELEVLLDHLLEEAGTENKESNVSLQGVIGDSAVMKQLARMVRRVAATQATVLIRGESGTGKEVIARAIHAHSADPKAAFVTVDCTNIPANLMEAELFGHERGAFTDAKAQKQGLLETANGGTVFLDEIGLMPIELQAKLLSVLETHRFRRVGGTQEIAVAIRVLAATNEDLEERVKQGKFREDLYYRLNVVPLDLAPLRERGEDVLLVADHYMEVYSSMHGTARKILRQDARELLLVYPWPGNVRELRNVIERAVLMTDSNIVLPSNLIIDRRSRRNIGTTMTPGIRLDADGGIFVVLPQDGLALEMVEQALILEALRQTKGNVTKAATLLHLSRDTLRYRMDKYELEWADA